MCALSQSDIQQVYFTHKKEKKKKRLGGCSLEILNPEITRDHHYIIVPA